MGLSTLRNGDLAWDAGFALIWNANDSKRFTAVDVYLLNVRTAVTLLKHYPNKTKTTRIAASR